MKRLSDRQAYEMAKREREAVEKADREQAGSAENRREQWWHLMPIQERQRAVSLAGLDKNRAILPLATFTDAERTQVRLAIEAHVHRMGLIAQALHARNTPIHGYLH